MKTSADVRNRLKLELDQWFLVQVRNPFERFYLYYCQSTPERDGGFVFAREQPANNNYQLADTEHVNRGKTVEANFCHYLPIVNRLPILSIS